MKWLLQVALLRVYKLAAATGLLSTRFGRELMAFSYKVYKSRLEADYVPFLEPFVVAGTLVIDVGAHTGFFTRYFAKWVQETGHVIAIEPDPVNFGQLEEMLRKEQLSAIVEAIPAAATAQEGEANLVLDPNNPANHKIGSDGIRIKTVTIDRLVEDQKLPVSFIKIDVQGAELLVLQGAVQTIKRFQPRIIIEIHEPSLAEFNVTPSEVLQFLANCNYDFYLLENGKLSNRLTIEDILSRSDSYTDVICMV
jgi:FkbM family methyltransferase